MIHQPPGVQSNPSKTQMQCNENHILSSSRNSLVAPLVSFPIAFLSFLSFLFISLFFSLSFSLSQLFPYVLENTGHLITQPLVNLVVY